MINFISVSIGLFFSCIALTNIRKGKKIAFSVVYIVFFLLFILPLFFDMWNDQPVDYDKFLNLTKAARDKTTNIIYTVFTIYFSVVFFFIEYAKNKREELKFIISESVFENAVKRYKIGFYMLIYLPIPMAFFSPESGKLWIYGFYAMRGFSDEMLDFMPILSSAVIVSVVSTYVILLAKKRGIRSIFSFIPILFFDAYIIGKRYIPALIVVLTCYLIITDRRLKNISKIFIMIFFMAITIGYFTYYQMMKETILHTTVSGDISDRRLNYFRDHTVKLAIYAEIHPDDGKILEYRGQSLLFYLTFFIPRSAWDDKPYRYGVYLVSSALNKPIVNRSWTITTSIFDELICNLGLWMILFFPFMLHWIIQYGKNVNNSLSTALSILIICLLFTASTAAYILVYIAYIIYTQYMRRQIKKHGLHTSKLYIS